MWETYSWKAFQATLVFFTVAKSHYFKKFLEHFTGAAIIMVTTKVQCKN